MFQRFFGTVETPHSLTALAENESRPLTSATLSTMATAVWDGKSSPSFSSEAADFVFLSPSLKCVFLCLLLKLKLLSFKPVTFHLLVCVNPSKSDCAKVTFKTELGVLFNKLKSPWEEACPLSPCRCSLIGQRRARCSVTECPYGRNVLCHGLRRSPRSVVQQLRNHDTCWLLRQITVLSWLYFILCRIWN